MKISSLKDLDAVKESVLKKLVPLDTPSIRVGLATCGISVGGNLVYEEFKKQIKEKNLNISLSKTGCIGFCKEEPLVNITIPKRGILILHKIEPEDVNGILETIINNKENFDKVLCRINTWDHIINGIIDYGNGFKDIPLWNELNFFKGQKKIVLRNAGIINPEDIEEYIAVGGYKSLYKSLKEMSPQEIINEIKDSGLRGRGGAGFPTSLKWERAYTEKNSKKYVICNADEGDPGAYMNRNEMESDPHSIIEGMIIGGYTIGASEGVIYIRAEYPLAVERLQKAIEEAKFYSLLGGNILGSDFNFDISIVKGAGAFVCGEETALIASIEGKSGRPKPRPPYPAQKGLWNKPTNINNVETWTNIPVIISKTGKWFSNIGTINNTGTKVFSLVGKVNNVGLVEVELGTPIEKIIYDIGQGAADNKDVKAIQVGGPSGGCIPSNLFNTSVDYNSLTKLGAIMGSGGMVVMDQDTCMVDVSHFFLDFTMDESCGKCVPCRKGLKTMFEILEKIISGNGEEQDLIILEELANTVKKTSLCGLGQTAPNPILTTLKYFKDEYQSHISQKICPAKICKNFIEYTIDTNKCTGCTVCAKQCPVHVIDGSKNKPHFINQQQCIKCGTCLAVCRFNAVSKIPKNKV
jgi:NADH-quinone oxidoreductase subunit F